MLPRMPSTNSDDFMSDSQTNRDNTAAKPAAERPLSSRAERQARTRRKWLVGVGCVVVLAGLAVAAKLAYPKIKLARGRQNAAEAMSALRKGDLAIAGGKVKTALAMAPREPETLRAAAEYCRQRSDPAGINYYRMLLGTPEGGLAEKTNLINLAHATKRLQPAREVLREMLLANSNDTTALRYLVENHLLAGDVERAIKASALALKTDPTNTWLQLTLGSLLMDDPRGGKYQDEGRKLLFGLAIGQRPESRAAQNRIARSPNLTKTEMSILQKQIGARTNRALEDEMLIYDLRQRQNPGDGPAIVGEALRRYVQEDPGVGLASVIGWAASGRHYDPVLKAVPVAFAQTNASVAPLYSAVLAASEKWDDLERFLGAAESSIGKVLSAGFRARLAMARGNKAEAEAQFRSLGSVKEVSVIDARILAEQAEAAGLPDVAVDVYQRIAAEPGAAIDASRECLRLLGRLEDQFKLREVAGRLTRVFPNDDNLAAEFAWANLVAGQDLPEALTVLNRLHEKAPANPVWTYALAMAELKLGRSAKASELIQAANVAPKSRSPRMQLVHALVLAANDQREAGRRAAREVNLARLRPAEQAMLKDLL